MSRIGPLKSYRTADIIRHVNMLVQEICTLSVGGISTDAGNGITLGSDGKLYVSLTGGPIVSADAGNAIVVGSDDGAFLSSASLITAASVNSFSNKTVNLSSNTLTGTLAQFNTALSDGDFATLAGTETLTNKWIQYRIGTAASSATPTINTDTVDEYHLTAQAADITSFSDNLSGTPVNGQELTIVVKGTATRAIAWGASFAATDEVALPTTTSGTKALAVKFKIISSVSATVWQCVAVVNAGS